MKCHKQKLSPFVKKKFLLFCNDLFTKIVDYSLMLMFVWKNKVDQGLRLYNQHKQQQAVRKWKSALKAIRKREDKFSLLGYLYQAYMDWGKYRDALEYAHRQLFISEELDSPNMRAESYLNLARAHQRLGGLERLVQKHSYIFFGDSNWSNCNNFTFY